MLEKLIPTISYESAVFRLSSILWYFVKPIASDFTVKTTTADKQIDTDVTQTGTLARTATTANVTTGRSCGKSPFLHGDGGNV